MDRRHPRGQKNPRGQMMQKNGRGRGDAEKRIAEW